MITPMTRGEQSDERGGAHVSPLLLACGGLRGYRLAGTEQVDPRCASKRTQEWCHEG